MLAKKILLALMAQSAYANNETNTSADTGNVTDTDPGSTPAADENTTVTDPGSTPASQANQTDGGQQQQTPVVTEASTTTTGSTAAPATSSGNATAGADGMTVDAKADISATIGMTAAAVDNCPDNFASLFLFGATTTQLVVLKTIGLCGGMLTMPYCDDSVTPQPTCCYETTETTGDGLTADGECSLDTTTGFMTCDCGRRGRRLSSKRRLSDVDVTFAASSTAKIETPADFELASMGPIENLFEPATLETEFKDQFQINAVLLKAGKAPSMGLDPAPDAPTAAAAITSSFLDAASTGNFTISGFESGMETTDSSTSSAAAAVFTSAAAFAGAALLF